MDMVLVCLSDCGAAVTPTTLRSHAVTLERSVLLKPQLKGGTLSVPSHLTPWAPVTHGEPGRDAESGAATRWRLGRQQEGKKNRF